MTFDRWRRWLLAVGALLCAFGTAMALLSATPLFALAPIDSVFWGAAGPADGTRDFQAWIYAAWGATLAGWGLTIAGIAAYPLARREGWAWRLPAVATVLWFVLDTAVSAAHGVWFNVAVNVVVLVAAGVPLLGMRQSLRRSGARG
jgi:hypothetical protein